MFYISKYSNKPTLTQCSEQVSTGPELDGIVIAANPPTLMEECVPACIPECISFTGLLGWNTVY